MSFRCTVAVLICLIHQSQLNCFDLPLSFQTQTAEQCKSSPVLRYAKMSITRKMSAILNLSSHKLCHKRLWVILGLNTFTSQVVLASHQRSPRPRLIWRQRLWCFARLRLMAKTINHPLVVTMNGCKNQRLLMVVVLSLPNYTSSREFLWEPWRKVAHKTLENWTVWPLQEKQTMSSVKSLTIFVQSVTPPEIAASPASDLAVCNSLCIAVPHSQTYNIHYCIEYTLRKVISSGLDLQIATWNIARRHSHLLHRSNTKTISPVSVSA